MGQKQVKNKMAEKDTFWSWIVLASVTAIVFLETGIMKSLSVLLPSLREQLSSQTWIIGSSISIVYGWGFVLGFMYVQENVAIGMLSHYFDKYFAVSVSTFLFGGNVSVIVTPPMAQVFLETYGWRGTICVLSAISFNTLLCSLIITLRKKEDRNMNNKREKTRLLPDNMRTSENLHEERYQFFKKSMGGSLLSDIHFVVCVLAPGFAYGYTYAGWLIYTVSYAVSNGATMREAALVSTCGGIGLTLTRLVIPIIIKHVHYKYLIYSSLLLASGSLALGSIWVTLTGMYTSSTIFGVAISILSASAHIAAREKTSADEYVLAVAWFHLVFGFASILAGSISGIIYDVTGSFQISYVVLAAVSLLSAVPLGLDDLWTRMKVVKNAKL